MKYREITLVILAALCSLIALAEDFKTINGKEYKNATVSRVEPDGIVVKTKSGISKIYFTELPSDVQQRFGYDTAKIAQLQKQQEAAEREREEKEKNADADLRRAAEQFQSAEQRASQAYQTAPKGTLVGQVFVSSRGGENFKLGAVQVGLFARDAIDPFVAEIKKYADYKIQPLRGPMAEAKAALDSAEANFVSASDAFSQAIRSHGDYKAANDAEHAAHEAVERARKQYSEMNDNLNAYYSGAFYFAFFQFPIRTVETDAEGKFIIEVPRTGKFVIAAQARRSVMQYTEHYYWLQPTSLEGQQQLTQNLSNNNLTSTTGASSLIHTQD